MYRQQFWCSIYTYTGITALKSCADIRPIYYLSYAYLLISSVIEVKHKDTTQAATLNWWLEKIDDKKVKLTGLPVYVTKVC